MNKNHFLNKMLVLAAVSHEGQFDKGGKPYILHPLKVMHYLKSNDEELMCIALGHDLLEDTDVTVETLEFHGFTERIIDGIVAMTKVKGQSFEEYKAQVMDNTDAMRVKMCDLRHNTDIRRLKGISDKDIERTVKYQRFYMEILQKLDELASVTVH